MLSCSHRLMSQNTASTQQALFSATEMTLLQQGIDMVLTRDVWVIPLVSTTWDVGTAMDTIFESESKTGEVGNVRTPSLVENFSGSHHEVCQICMVDCLANGISKTLTCGHILCQKCVEDICRFPYANCTVCRTVIAPSLNVPRRAVQIVEHAYTVWVIPWGT